MNEKSQIPAFPMIPLLKVWNQSNHTKGTLKVTGRTVTVWLQSRANATTIVQVQLVCSVDVHTLPSMFPEPPGNFTLQSWDKPKGCSHFLKEFIITLSLLVARAGSPRDCHCLCVSCGITHVYRVMAAFILSADIPCCRFLGYKLRQLKRFSPCQQPLAATP